MNGFTYYRTDSDESCEWIHLLQNEILIEMHDCSCEWIHLLQNEILIEMHDCSCEWIHLLQNEILIEMHDCSCECNSLTTERDSDRNARLQL